MPLEALDDAAFDDLLPKGLRVKAGTHFTPIAVARRAARLLAPMAGASILDIGSGVGKFCLVAAHAMPDAEFVGVEWRPHLVALANQLATRWALTNVRFIHADAFDLDWSSYDAFYLFNPFAEQIAGPFLDNTIDFAPGAYFQQLSGARGRLARARGGTRVVTYHGCDSVPRPEYRRVGDVRIDDERLELWIKAHAQPEASSP